MPRPLGLIDVDSSAGINLVVDRVGITYSDGLVLGDASSPVQVSSRVVGHHPVPSRAMPVVVARVGIDRAAVTLTDAELTLAGDVAPVMLRGQFVDRVTEAIDACRPTRSPW